MVESSHKHFLNKTLEDGFHQTEEMNGKRKAALEKLSVSIETPSIDKDYILKAIIIKQNVNIINVGTIQMI